MPRQAMSVMREQTNQFIAENPVIIDLVRHAKVDDGAGGSTKTDTQVSQQIVRLVKQVQYRDLLQRTFGGEMLNPRFALVCKHDADIETGDTFVHQGVQFMVEWVNDLGYEKLAEVSTR